MKSTQNRDEKIVFRLQLTLLASFVLAMGGVIVWIIHLILLSRELHDVPSASIGIGIAAIPVFLTLLSVFNYVFWGMLLNREEDVQ